MYKLNKQLNKRNLTFFGKITVIKTLLSLRFTYLFQTCFTPKDIISRINKIFYGFLWSNKREKIRRKTTICSKENSRLDMIHIEYFINAIKTKFILWSSLFHMAIARISVYCLLCITWL